MKRFFQLALCLSTLLLAADTSAQATVDFCSLGIDGLVIDAKPMNGATSTLTFTFGPRACARNVASYKWLVIEAEFTYDSKAGNILYTCLTGRSVATANKVPQVCAGAGTCTLIDAGVATKAVTGSKKYEFRIGLRGYRAWSCIVSHDNSPTADEIFTGYAYLTD